tara:strand:+ start:92 stop:2005 length:1914 start_codon:yes stop_codon:yes gene_type:complete
MNKIALNILLLFSVSFTLDIQPGGIEFSYIDNNASSVFLVGSMNEWNTDATPLQKDNNGVWSIVINLEPGKYSYKFYVDGNWYYDQNNSEVEDDGYGGSNSIITISKDGSLLKDKKTVSNGVKSSFNPKIYFKGRYSVDNVFAKNETDYFMLDKPIHDLDFGIQIDFNPNFISYTILNVNNIKEGTEMWRTHFNYERTYIKLNADYFNLMAFDNYGLISFDNPLEIVGSIGYNNYDFGFNYSGILAETSTKFSDLVFQIIPINLKTKLLLSDRNGLDEDDIYANRIVFSIPYIDNNLDFGVSNYVYKNKLSDQIIQVHDNRGLDFNYTKYYQNSNWKDKMSFSISAEYSEYENSDQDSLKLIWMEGENIFVNMFLKFPSALDFSSSYLKTSFNLSGNSFFRDRLTLGINYKYNNFHYSLYAQTWNNSFLDSLSWKDYFKYVEKSDGNGRWFQQHTELAFEKYTLLGYKSGFFWESKIQFNFHINKNKLSTQLNNKFAHYNFVSKPKFVENIFICEYELDDRWKIQINSRIPYYNDSFLDLITDFYDNKDVFISNYYEFEYSLSKNTWIALGYGINPKMIDSISDEFYFRGREEYLDKAVGLSEYIENVYGGFGERIRDAEIQLMNAKQIQIRAVIEF